MSKKAPPSATLSQEAASRAQSGAQDREPTFSQADNVQSANDARPAIPVCIIPVRNVLQGIPLRHFATKSRDSNEEPPPCTQPRPRPGHAISRAGSPLSVIEITSDSEPDASVHPGGSSARSAGSSARSHVRPKRGRVPDGDVIVITSDESEQPSRPIKASPSSSNLAPLPQSEAGAQLPGKRRGQKRSAPALDGTRWTHPEDVERMWAVEHRQFKADPSRTALLDAPFRFKSPNDSSLEGETNARPL